MSTCVNPRLKSLSRGTVLIQRKTDSDMPIKTMGNVRRVSCNNPFAKTAIARPPPECSLNTAADTDMNHRHSTPNAAICSLELDDHSESRTVGERSGSQTNSTIRETIDVKNHRKFRGPVNDSLLSSTSLILASSSTLDTAAYVEKTFINRSTSLEDLWLKSHDYNFENLVFEGGGSKGMAYVGAIQVIPRCNYNVKELLE